MIASHTEKLLQAESLAQTLEGFHREGCAVIPGILDSVEVAEIRAISDDHIAHPRAPKYQSEVLGTFVLRHAEELDPAFKALITRPAIRQLAEGVLGEGAVFNAMNVIRNSTGQAIARWHVDDVVEMPLPDSIPRYDPRMRMPVLWMTVQIALSDIDTLENGPTQYVPGSHYSGRHPISQDDPRFEGRPGVDVYCKAGDVYLTNHQCWHRGAPNLSARTRYILQVQYAARWADRRFKGHS
jgi:ectoine hydroxylase-related dioxygenase (phytanoyl-CoA dioxygenase family)